MPDPFRQHLEQARERAKSELKEEITQAVTRKIDHIFDNLLKDVSQQQKCTLCARQVNGEPEQPLPQVVNKNTEITNNQDHTETSQKQTVESIDIDETDLQNHRGYFVNAVIKEELSSPEPAVICPALQNTSSLINMQTKTESLVDDQFLLDCGEADCDCEDCTFKNVAVNSKKETPPINGPLNLTIKSRCSRKTSNELNVKAQAVPNNYENAASETNPQSLTVEIQPTQSTSNVTVKEELISPRIIDSNKSSTLPITESTDTQTSKAVKDSAVELTSKDSESESKSSIKSSIKKNEKKPKSSKELSLKTESKSSSRSKSKKESSKKSHTSSRSKSKSPSRKRIRSRSRSNSRSPCYRFRPRSRSPLPIPRKTERFHTLYLNCLVTGCTEKLTSREELDRHLLDEHGIFANRCPHKYCSESFPTLLGLQSHITDDHEYARKAGWECFACPERYPASKQLGVHIFFEHQDGRFDCASKGCNYYSQYRKDVYDHYGEAHGDAQETSSYINRRYHFTGTIVQQPIRRYVDTKLTPPSVQQFTITTVKCLLDNCSEFFLTLDDLEEHLEDVHRLGCWFCPAFKCDKTFRGRGELEVHIQQKHSSISRWACEKCSHVSDDFMAADEHRVLAHAEGQFRCVDCPKVSKHRQDIIEHYRHVHERERRRGETH